jgi:hypothetical protein
LILFALAMVGILFMVALVIDFSNVRNTRQDSKLLSDSATTAGLRSLAPDGVAHPWQAACTALDYLTANESDLSLAVEYRNGAGTVLVGNPCASLRNLECVATDSTTWAWIHAVAGEHTYDIKSAYMLPDANFPEDAAAYSGDVGAAAQGGCDQLAVIATKTDDAFFGGIGGAADYSTAIRSVGRVKIGDDGKAAIALVLLEQNDCQSLNWAAGSGALAVRGTADRPGIIHSDSRGDGDNCGSGDVVLEGKQNSGPRVRALAAPDNPAKYGIISTFARFSTRTNDANWTSNRMASGTEVWACDPDSGASGPSPCTQGPTGNKRVTRKPADDRYLASVVALRTEANGVFTAVAADATPAGYTAYSTLPGNDCDLKGSDPNVTINFVGPVYVDCATLQIGNDKLVTFANTVTKVAFKGNLNLSGTGTLDLRAPRQVFVHNLGGAGDALPAGSQGQIRVNQDAAASCEARQTADRNATTELVIRQGGLSSSAGGTVHLCSTFVHLMGGQVTGPPVDASAGTYPAPYSNSANTGTIKVQAGSHLEWTAPNTISAAPTTGSYRFEDLALWSETQRDNEVGGGGDMVLKGVFYLPNTGPDAATGGLTLSGGSSGAINLDAQLWVRKLHFNGGAEFRMRSNPADTVPAPVLEGLGMVR